VTAETYSPAASLPPDRRGRLRNGATPGDFLAAPRCGAWTRSGACCRQPAMKNRRCRMHGGLSTGPRTAEGRARCAAARRTHGFYSAEMVALRRAGTAYCRRMDTLIASLKVRRTAGHEVFPQNLRTDTVGATPAQSAEGRLSRRGRPSGRRHGRPHGAAPTAATAGHGLLPPNLSNRSTGTTDTASASITPAARSSASASLRLRGESSGARSTLTAGHGVLPPLSARPLDGAHPSRELTPRHGFVQRTLLGSTALGLGRTVKPPVAARHGVLPSFSVAPTRGPARPAVGVPG
jgi:hypothetical protein